MYELGFLIAIAAFILAIVAMQKNSRLQTQIRKLKDEIGDLSAQLAAVRKIVLTPPPDGFIAAEKAPAELPAAEQAEAPQAAALEAEAAAIASQTPAAAPEPAAPEPRTSAAWGGRGAEAVAPDMPVSAPPPAPDMEQTLASRWFVWIGGIAIAIGGLLFVKYAYDNGLISPTLQIVLGLIVGLVLVGAGEMVRRRASSGMPADTNYVPAALSAAGLATIFASIYAAYALYGLVPPMVAFFGLAATGLAAMGLSRWQGPLIAALGLIGSYVTPALIPSDNPNAWGFFPYLLVILVASFATLRGRNWWWLGYAAVAGAGLWTALWITGTFEPADVWPVGLFAHLLGLVAFYAIKGPSILSEESGSFVDPKTITQPLVIGLFGLAVECGLLALLVDATAHGNIALFMIAAAVLGLIAIAWIKDGIAVLAPLGGLLMFLALMVWNEAAFHAETLDENGIWTWSNAISPETERFLRWLLASGAVLTLVGCAGVLKRPSAPQWGVLGGASAVLFIAGAWGRADFLLADSTWAMIAIALAAVLLATAAAASRNAFDAPLDIGAGLLAAASAILLVFAAGRFFDRVTLTLVIAALGFAYAALTFALRARLLGPISAALASLSALRLFVSRELWNDDRTLAWGQHWVLYGYGVPAILSYAASRVLHRTGHPRSAVALEGISLGLAMSLIALELRVLIAGNVIYEQPQFLEMAAHLATWFAAAYGLMHRQRMFSSLIATWGARVLLAMAVLGTVFVSLIALNPVITGDAMPGNMVFNALLLAYLVPALMLALAAVRLDVIGWQRLRSGALGLSLLLAFAYVTMETKRVFQGHLMVPVSLTVAEAYAYSAVWLVFALALFVAGIRLGKQYVRLAGLGVMALVVLKVFVADMSNLEGLYRIASFVGLGLCLVGIGWLYQRFVQPPKPA